MNGKYQVGSGRIVAFTHDTPFINNTLTQTDEGVKVTYNLADTSRIPTSLEKKHLIYQEKSVLTTIGRDTYI